MSHHLRGVLGPDDSINEFARDWLREPLPLGQNISLLALTDSLVESITELTGKGDNRPYEQFEFLPSSVVDLLERYSSACWVAYFETEYFGGVGTQAVGVWRDRELILGPKISSASWDPKNRNYVVDNGWPINEALRFVGVWTDGSKDEFDTLGLGQYRSTDAFDAA